MTRVKDVHYEFIVGMHATVYAEGSETTADEENAIQPLDYYLGSFRSIQILVAKLSVFCDTDVRIGSVWGIAAPSQTLERIDIEDLEKKGCDAILYKRVGVAPIDVNTRDEIIEQARMRSRMSFEEDD